MASVRVSHLFTQFRSLGGVESVLKHHHAKDAPWGIDSSFIIYFEVPDDPVDRVHFLGLNSRSTIQEARRKLGEAIAETQPAVAVYHEPWGMPFLVDVDRAARRIMLLHGKTPGLEEALQFRRAWADGILCVDEPLRQTALGCLAGLEEKRIEVVPYPIAPPPVPFFRPAIRDRPLVLGFNGRILFQQKRVDRLPELGRLLDRSGLDYTFEFLGEGHERPWLEKQFSHRTNFKFHGRKTGDEYWRVLQNWDVILFVSDYEGTPIALLEALSVGVVPIYPKIGSGGDGYAHHIQSDLLYEPDDFAHVVRSLQHLSSLPNDQLLDLRQRCRHAVAGHLGDAYLDRFSRFVRQILEWPKVSQSVPRRRPPLLDHCSFTWLARIGAVRRWVRRLVRKPTGVR